MIRVGTINDIEDLVSILELQYNESQFVQQGYNFNRTKITDLLDNLLASEDGIIFVYESEMKIKGIFIGLISESLFADIDQAHELAFYVLKEYRGSKIGFRLLRAYITWATEMEAHQIMIDNSTTPDPEKVGSFYEKMGFKKIGGTYQYTP